MKAHQEGDGWVIPIVCCMCGKVMGYKKINYRPPGRNPEDAATHSYCDYCYIAQDKEIDKIIRRRNEKV